MTRRDAALLAGWCLAATLRLHAATNLVSPDEIPPLRPPRPELAPTFWEQYGLWPALVGALVLLLLATGLWVLLRPKPPLPVPPESQARQALEELRQAPETGAVLSRVSQVVRHYFSAAFGLPPEEMTTAEFCQVLKGVQRLGPDLSKNVGDFLRQCDERKFALSPPLPPLGAAATAATLISQAEARRDAGAITANAATAGTAPSVHAR